MCESAVKVIDDVKEIELEISFDSTPPPPIFFSPVLKRQILEMSKREYCMTIYVCFLVVLSCFMFYEEVMTNFVWYLLMIVLKFASLVLFLFQISDYWRLSLMIIQILIFASSKSILDFWKTSKIL